MPLKSYEVGWGPYLGAVILAAVVLWLLWLKFRSQKNPRD